MHMHTHTHPCFIFISSDSIILCNTFWQAQRIKYIEKLWWAACYKSYANQVAVGFAGWPKIKDGFSSDVTSQEHCRHFLYHGRSDSGLSTPLANTHTELTDPRQCSQSPESTFAASWVSRKRVPKDLQGWQTATKKRQQVRRNLSILGLAYRLWGVCLYGNPFL